jgi:hypothetical protein
VTSLHIRDNLTRSVISGTIVGASCSDCSINDASEPNNLKQMITALKLRKA